MAYKRYQPHKQPGHVPQFSRGPFRGDVLLRESEARAVVEFMTIYRMAMARTGPDAGDDLGRAFRVMGRQLAWIDEQRAKANV